MSLSSKQNMRRFALPLTLIAVVWLGMIMLDWSMRFAWFHWERTIVSTPSQAIYMGDSPPLSVREIATRKGGDLSGMLGGSRGAGEYEVEHPGCTTYSDEYGLPNIPPTTGVNYRVALVGDSFMVQGSGTSNFLGGRLSRLLGEPVYTIAQAGRGPARPFSGALLHPYFRMQPPQLVILGVPERDATGYIFTSMAYQTLRNLQATNSRSLSEGTRVLWSQLAPAQLGKSLPNTSIMAQAMRRVWTRLRGIVGSARRADVYVSNRAFAGFPMLFYRVNIEALFWLPETRNVEAARRAAQSIQSQALTPRGIDLVIVLIPEKEQVYREYVPLDAYPGGGDVWPSSVFDTLAPALAAEGIAVVNLLPVFREAAARGELIYWPDDTHWNEAGVQLASETIAHAIKAHTNQRALNTP